jgi:hypothetical protein
MTDSDNDFWECPPEQAIAWHGEFRLSLVERPFPTDDGVLPAHDPARAREFAAAFGTIGTVLGEADRIEATERLHPRDPPPGRGAPVRRRAA